MKPTFRLFPCNPFILLMALFQNRILLIYNYLFLLIVFETSKMQDESNFIKDLKGVGFRKEVFEPACLFLQFSPFLRK